MPGAPSSDAHWSTMAPPASGCSHGSGILCSNAGSGLTLAFAGSSTLPSTTSHKAMKFLTCGMGIQCFTPRPASPQN